MTESPDELDYIARGQLFLRQGYWPAAVANFDQALDLNPNYAPAWYYRGMAYRNAGNLDQAIADYTAAIAADPRYSVAFYARGVVYRQLEDYQQAILDYDQAIALEPDDADFYYARGVAYASLTRYTLAIADFRQSLDINPENPDACYNLGRAYWESQQWAEAFDRFDAALELDPNHPSTRYFLGNTELADGMPCLAQLEYDKALIAVPESADIWYNRGIALNHQCAELVELGWLKYLPKVSANAVTSFSNALRYGRDAVHLYLNRGIAHTYAEQYPQAQADLNRALELDATLADAYRARAHLYWEMGNPSGAEADLQRYRQLTGRNAGDDDPFL